MIRRALAVLTILAASPATAAAAALESLAVASYNVQFVTPDLPVLRDLLREFPGHKPNVAARARAIGRALACFDVIGLQETINDRRRAELLAELEARGRACGKPSRLRSGRLFAAISGPKIADEADWLPLVDDELALASRLPVVAVNALTFAAAAGADALAAKGVLHARLARAAGSADVLEVYVTHLQADAEQADVRRRQVEELAAFVRRTARAAVPVLLLGDLNVWGGAPDRADPASEYNHLMAALNAAVAPRHFVDLWLAAHADDPETASGTKPRRLADGTLRPREKRVDFVLLAGAGRARPLAMRRDFLPSALVVDGEPVGDLSNHAALLAEIAWRPPAAPLTAEAASPPPFSRR
jgi:endonuclease/exonuclease/phosphatase family metal-dependent hydrolase